MSMLIVAFLQLELGVFLLVSHYAYGKFSRKNASNASLFYILGAETSTTLLFLLIYFALTSLYIIPIDATNTLLTWIIAGIILAIGVIFPFCYYRKGKGTQLFISRKLAKKFTLLAKSVKSRSDAFMLGLFSGLPELLFSTPIYTVAALEIMKIGNTPIVRATLVLCFVIIKIVPLIAAYMTIDLGHGIVPVQKSRAANKKFMKFFVSALYLIISALIITFGVFSV